MKVLRQRRYLFALLALLLVFGACKGESPTAPPSGGSGGGSGSGGTTPPVGANITLSVSNAAPLAGSTTTVTATVTVDNNPAPNGTAVEFSSTPIGLFSDSGTASTIRTTTNGVATAVLTSATAGVATVTAVVNNVTRTITVTFATRPTTPTPPDTAPAITAVNPSAGRPEGGEIVTITGRNLRGPVRVIFDFGDGGTKEATVVSATTTQIQVLSPRTDLGTGQTKSATIIVFTEAGTAAESRATAAFTYRRATLTPSIITVSPDSGPIDGGTRITIFGDGFEAPVQVSFAPGASAGGAGWSAIEVVNVTFNQIIAITPPASSVNPAGSGPLTGAVDLRVLNINSNTEAVKGVVFRYTPKMQITAAGPTVGSSLGGARVQIDGIGFNDPVAVTFAGVGAQVVSVTGTRIIAIASPLASPCDASTGAITVTNIENGDTATGPTFQYVAVNPSIVSVTSAGTITPGSSVTLGVLNPGLGVIRIGAGSATLLPSPSVSTTSTGTQTFTIALPTTGFTFPTLQCTTAGGLAGTQFGPVSVDLTFTNSSTTCTDTLTGGLTVQPPGANACTAAPSASIIPASPTCAVAPAVVAAGAGTSNATITISNAANTRDLIISAATLSTFTNGTATIGPATAVIPAGASQAFTVTIDPTAAGAVSGSVTFTTNDPARQSITACVTGSGT